MLPAFLVLSYRYFRAHRDTVEAEKKRDVELAAASEKRSREYKPNVTVKEIIRPDRKERVVVFQRSDGTYGADIESWSDNSDRWMSAYSLVTGAVYASIAIAESEICVTTPWVRHDSNTCPTRRPENNARDFP